MECMLLTDVSTTSAANRIRLPEQLVVKYESDLLYEGYCDEVDEILNLLFFFEGLRIPKQPRGLSCFSRQTTAADNVHVLQSSGK